MENFGGLFRNVFLIFRSVKACVNSLSSLSCIGSGLFAQFERLAKISKMMEGENYVLSSTYWGALQEIESIFSPHLGDSETIASLRSAMNHDHFSKRITLASSLSQALHVLMHLLDPRSDSACLI